MNGNIQSNKETGTGVEFHENDGWKAVKYYRESSTPKIIRWVIKHSGGLIKNEQLQLALEMYYNDNNTFPCFNEGAVSGCLLGALAAYGNLPSKDPWGIDYQWHNPGCCVDECAMILSAGPNNAMCGGGSDVGCEHVMSQTASCSSPSSSYDDIGFYFGQVKDHK